MTNFSAVPEPSKDLHKRATLVRRSANALSQTSNQQRRSALIAIAETLEIRSSEIVRANIQDLENAFQEGVGEALMARLKLDEVKLKSSIEGVRQVASLPDPLGIRQLHRELDTELTLERVTVPLGVIGVIFEARPDALIQISSLAIRSGNGAILKGGSEARHTNEALMVAIHEALGSTEVSPYSLSLLTTRKESLALLKLDRLVDLIIPRGSNEFVRFIQDNTRIPVLGHADGICHLYIDSEADVDQAIRISIDSKTQYPAACNSIETLLIHKDIAHNFLVKALPAFRKFGVKLLGDEKSQALGIKGCAKQNDWSTEYLDLTLSVKIVDSLDEALDHINCYSSRHTDAIVTQDKHVAEKFLSSVDSSGVYHNCSTRFADGFRYGFGAEIGISTQTLPTRGPVGLEGLITYIYRLRGSGQISNDYSSGLKTFTHNDLPL